ncbi:NFACT RNA binding domain-containing protein [Spirochaeta isovalerica]|uniref:Putative ribosome quality control (RQC) complex YloA/Tae2 family protein n=1 Tax=Spirochaeta isovalerica TaxID=150 RepID=A0A841R508_9SPIO|nr:NFACT RNA binding domain-containing protein [Spirochaeta isovalerica]MBB6478883.1 putative ribosome quality control (RQC) complex YloA/Tae2 family protein [Spirochaeta isovalerica]
MSLNNSEIDLILKELDLISSRVDRISQPDRFSLYLETYGREGKQKIQVSLDHNSVRLCRVDQKPELPSTPPRFAQLLTARIKGSRILSVSQPEKERIVHLVFSGEEENYNLWIRFWSGNPNIILTGENNIIIDVLYRKKNQNEYPGKTYQPDFSQLSTNKDPVPRPVRDYEGFSDFNSFVNDYYNKGKGVREFESRKELVLKKLKRKFLQFENLHRNLLEKQQYYSRYDDLRLQGELIGSSLHLLKKGDSSLKTKNYYDGKEICIPLKPELSPSENRDDFYALSKKYRRGLEKITEDLADVEEKISEQEILINKAERIAGTEELELFEKALPDSPADSEQKRGSVKINTGLRFKSGKYEILVGRNSRENDALLRKYARGNDIWLHVRQHPGGYVFIKTLKGKSVPLETLLNAANLAILYSSLKKKTEADIHYTEVKNLRRIKGGAPGRVLVNNDKNIHIKYDEKRIEILRNKES